VTRNVVISGGGSGIGRAAAHWFAAQGDRVWIVGRRESALLDTAASHRGISPVVADLSAAAGAAHVAHELGDEQVHVVVAAAGGTAAQVPSDLDGVVEVWRRDIDQNLMTAVLLVEALQPHIVRPGGRVIGLGSIGAQLGSGYGGSYGAAKAALHAWIFWLAERLGRDGITANLVLPGYIPDTEFFGDRLNPEFDQVRVDRTLVGRAGTPEEVAAAIGFLASADAGFITGQLLGVNGGTVLGR
jgi:3-oxoacyl-[acyl-carrier protein] reductase